MKTLALAVLALTLLGAPVAHAKAHEPSTPTITTKGCDPPARWAARHDVRDAHIAITTEDGDAVLLATDEVVAMQLSDRAFHKLKRKLRDSENEEDDGALGHAIKVAVLAGVRTLLDHSAECPIRDVADARYRNGRLSLVTRDGRELFGDIDVDDHQVMENFSERDARAFVREFRRLKAGR
jgi:hypothetical protein